MGRTNNGRLQRRLLFATGLFVSLLHRGYGQGIELLGGVYKTSANVQSLLDLAKDIGEMREVQDGTGNADEAKQKDIYTNGMHATLVDENGLQTTFSLASLSLEAGDRMADDLLFNIYKRHFTELGKNVESEEDGYFDEAPVAQYADTIVNDLFVLNLPGIETQAALILNVWMTIAHELWVFLMNCKLNSDQDELLSWLDRAAALWIGQGQVRGDADYGFMLYNLAQKAGMKFNQNENSNVNEVLANSFFVNSLNELKEEVNRGTCATVPGYIEVREIVLQMYGYMNVPLVQELIHHIRQQTEAVNGDERDFIELYALSIMPQVAHCKPDTHKRMVELFITGTLDPQYRDEAILALQESYTCLRINCSMIGSYRQGEVAECTDEALTNKSYAGYHAVHDASQYSYLDRDIAQFKVLMTEQAWDSATDLYMFGLNARSGGSHLSLQRLATFGGRALVPQMQLFNNFFGVDDPDQGFIYADNIMFDVLKQEGPFQDTSPKMLTAIGYGVARYMITYMAVLQEVYDAVAKCVSGVPEEGLENWDRGAALFVGSMEGEAEAGSPNGNGQMLFGAAKQFCDVWGTCLKGDAEVNQDMIASLKLGRDSLDTGNCDKAKDAIGFIYNDLNVPLVQGTLMYSALNADPNPADVNLGYGFIMAQSLLPLVDAVDEQSGLEIAQNTGLESDAVDADAVFSAFSEAIDKGLDVECDFLGVYGDRDDGNVCATGPARPTPSPPPGQPYSPIGFGRYTFSTTNNPLGKFALDIRDMVAGDVSTAEPIYNHGKNAVFEDISTGQSRTLNMADLSKKASELMAQDPMFNIFRFAFQNQAEFGSTRQAPTTSDDQYGDITVQKAFDIDNVRLAAAAAVTLNVWMAVANSLYEAVRDCKDGETTAGLRIDDAAALWIGEEQYEAAPSGYLLYSLAETSSRRFATRSVEAPVNTKLIDLLNESKALTTSCTPDSDTWLTLRGKVSETTSQMVIPLLQELVYHLSEGGDNGNYVKLYALAVVPQMSACNPTAFMSLKEELVDRDYRSFDEGKVKHVLKTLRPLLGCMRITCDDLGFTRTSNGSFGQPLNHLCEKDQNEEETDGKTPRSIVGYTPSTDVYEESRIDLDILHIAIFMETLAYDVAKEYYEFGYNSKPAGELLSLKTLATDPARKSVPLQYEAFKTFFDSENYGHNMIMEAFDQEGQFEGASRQQLTEGVVGTALAVVTYMSILQQFFVASEQCEGSLGDAGKKAWDVGVAWYVGSIEGHERGGARDGAGQLLYDLGREMCEEFNTCDESTGAAAVNDRLIAAFTSGSSLIGQKNCASALTLITMDILPLLPVPLIQGTLAYALLNEDVATGSASPTLVSGHVLSRSVLPLVDGSSKADAAVIEKNMEFRLDKKPVEDGADAVFDAFKDALPKMAVKCSDIGIPADDPSLTVCEGTNTGVTNPNKPPPASTPTSLSDGLYTTSTYVQDRANIALDVKEMEKRLLGDNMEIAKVIYTTGENSKIFNEKGIVTGQRSLSGFSKMAPLEMTEEPLFNIFRYALGDSNGEFLGRDVGLYADSIVLEAFSNMDPAAKTLASEAAVVLNLWMYVVHELYQTHDRCKNGMIADDDGVHSIDEVAAYWIGDGQQTGDSEAGHLLYALTEKHGELFGVEEEGKARANTNILKLLNQAKLLLTWPNACTDDPTTADELLQVVNRIIPQMVIPLVQGLVYNLRESRRHHLKLYAQAYVPLISACSPDAFDFLRDKVIDQNYNVVEMETILETIYSTLGCFNLKCEDLGTYTADSTFGCVDPEEHSPLAGYKPESDVVAFSRIDLDLLELRILLKMEAYEAATDLYKHGKHALLNNSEDPQTLSLFELATTSDRQACPTFKSFERYYNDEKYAHTMIESAFDNPDLTTDQVTEVVLKTSQYTVMHMATLAALQEALDTCKSGNASAAGGSWDKAAAFMIGSLEGTEDGGSDQGMVLHGLAKTRCTQFGTCTKDPHNAGINERVIELMYAGRAELTAGSCDSLEKAVLDIHLLLLVPLIQSTLHYAIANTNTNLFSGDSNFAQGYVFSRSILPLVEDANRQSAAVLEKIMDLTSEDRDAAAVWDAMAQAYEAMEVDCTLVGGTVGANACNGSEGLDSGSSSSVSGGAIAGAVIGSLLAVALLVVGFRFARKRRSAKSDAETTSLVTNETGVLDADCIATRKPNGGLSPETTSFVRNGSGVLDADGLGGGLSPESSSRSSRGGLGSPNDSLV